MTLQEIYTEFQSFKTYEEKIKFLKELKENIFIKFDFEYDNLITKLYSDQQSESESA